MTEYERRLFHQELEITIARHHRAVQRRLLLSVFRVVIVSILLWALIAKMIERGLYPFFR